MKIYIAKTAGFCMGVRRAVEMILDASNSSEGPISSYGPLIHNPQVLEILRDKGIRVIKEIPERGSGTILIRAHGVPPEIPEMLERAGFTVKDATCPRVIKVQTIIRKHASLGYAVIIIGDDDHPEVAGLLGYAGDKGYAVNCLEDLDDLPEFDKAIIVAQTTQNTHFFNKVRKWAEQSHPHYKIFNTICDSTEKRQAEVKKLAEQVDALIVIGGRNSGNTQRLAEVAKEVGKPAFHIEDESELDSGILDSAQTIGISAGASTPNWIINKVIKKLEDERSKSGETWRSYFSPVQQSLLYTNFYIALGAGCLTYASTVLQGLEEKIFYIFIAFFYVLSMHTFNNLIGRNSDRFNDPDRASFYDKYKYHLAVLAFISGATGLVTSCAMGLIPFLILSAMSIMGLLYNIKLIPDKIQFLKYHRINEIPGSKTILIVLAWGIVTSVFPVLSEEGRITVASIVVLFWTLGMVFVRTVFFDILAMQGDRIVGTKTIPIIIGEKKTSFLLKRVLQFSFAFLFLGSLAGVITSLGYFLCLPLILMALVILVHEYRKSFLGFRPVFWVEANFLLAGLITTFWA
jgi:4-hydroxy-3-methylbut-2-enyl diphosphate reductase